MLCAIEFIMNKDTTAIILFSMIFACQAGVVMPIMEKICASADSGKLRTGCGKPQQEETHLLSEKYESEAYQLQAPDQRRKHLRGASAVLLGQDSFSRPRDKDATNA